MLEAHCVDHLARSEHVGIQRGKSRSKVGSIGFSHAIQKGSGEGTAGFGKIPVLCRKQVPPAIFLEGGLTFLGTLFLLLSLFSLSYIQAVLISHIGCII